MKHHSLKPVAPLAVMGPLAVVMLMSLAIAIPMSAADSPAGRNVYYFGNSFTGNTAPFLHEKLGASAGKQWTNQANLGAGWPIWYHLYHLRQGNKGGMDLVNGEWTLNPEFKPTNWQAASFREKKWDAIMLQPFGWLLQYGPVNDAWDKKVIFDEPTDIGDVASARGIIKIYLETNTRDGAVYIFQSWPTSALQRIAGITRGKELNHAQIEPIRRSYDFARDWFQTYDPSVMPWEGAGAHTRDCEFQLMEALIAAYPELWKAGRLRLMPVPDVWSLLDRRIRAGKVKGLVNIGEFHTDGGHTRAGLPAYLCAATFYAVIFQSRPHDLDYTIFNEADYGKDPFNDWGVPLRITPELAQAVNDAIWDVIQAHPYTGFGGSREKLTALEAAEKAAEPVRVLCVAGTPNRLPSKFQSAALAWQGDVDRQAGKRSAWQASFSAWYPLARYATEMREKNAHRELFQQLTDKNWTVCRLDKLILAPVGCDDSEADAAAWLAKQFLDTHPTGEVILFYTWPELKATTASRKELKLEAWQPLTADQLAALWSAFDYRAVFTETEPVDGNAAAAAAMTAKIQERLGPAQAKQLRAVHAGALLAQLDAKLRAGVLPGLTSVSAFYKDGEMLRTGLPRYALAALLHTAVHGSHPKALDASLFDQPKTYPPDDMDPNIPKGPGKQVVLDDEFDNGPHLPITAAGKKLVDDAVWELCGKK